MKPTRQIVPSTHGITHWKTANIFYFSVDFYNKYLILVVTNGLSTENRKMANTLVVSFAYCLSGTIFWYLSGVFYTGALVTIKQKVLFSLGSVMLSFGLFMVLN